MVTALLTCLALRRVHRAFNRCEGSANGIEEGFLKSSCQGVADSSRKVSEGSIRIENVPGSRQFQKAPGLRPEVTH